MDKSPGQNSRLILFTGDALSDLVSIDIATAQQWGEAQSERYINYLHETLTMIASHPALGEPLKDRPGYWRFLAKYSKRRSAHGHRIFYHEIENGIRVIRILHTAMNWPDHLGRYSRKLCMTRRWPQPF